ncbi:MAG: hypothetical protein ACRD8W_02590 [Nitrososphaeraceae archaeon]
MLLGCTDFTKPYLRIKDDPWPFVNLVRLALDAGMDEVQVLELLKIANGFLPSVRHEYDGLKAKLSSLEANVQQSERTLQELSDRTSKESKTLEQYRSIYNQLKVEIENLKTKKTRFENIIDSIQSNNEVYAKISASGSTLSVFVTIHISEPYILTIIFCSFLLKVSNSLSNQSGFKS